MALSWRAPPPFPDDPPEPDPAMAAPSTGDAGAGTGAGVDVVSGRPGAGLPLLCWFTPVGGRVQPAMASDP
jgi:hypothetical protein